MVSEKLIAFILKARQNKRSDDQVFQQLLAVGWKQEAIADAFSEIKSQKITAQAPAPQAAKPAQQPAQAAQAAPPWVKPAAPQQPVSQPAQQPAQATAPQPVQAMAQQQPSPVSSAPQQSSSAPPEAIQTVQAQSAPVPQAAPPQQAQAFPPPQAQMPATIPAPQPAPQSPIPPVNQIQLPPVKKSLFSSLFGKKQPLPQVANAQPILPTPQQAAAPRAAKIPFFQPRAPAQSTLQVPAASSQPSVQGQSTLATFSGASAQQSAANTAPASTALPPVQQPLPASAAPPAPQAPQASQAPQQPGAPKANLMELIMKFLPIIVFFIILAAAGAYYVLVMMPANSEPQTPSQPIAPIEQNASPSNPPQQASGPIDCGVDMDCFIRASSTCQVANVTRNLTVDSFGMLMSATTYMEIRNAPEAGKCMLYSLSMDSSAKFSDSTVVAALAKGISMDEIRKQEAESTKQARAAIGLSGTCKYGAAELSALLNKWKAGQFSSSDYSGADCSGKMFEGTNISTGFSANLTLKNSTSGKTNTSTKANTTAPAAKANTTAANTTAQGAKTSTTPPAAKTSTTPANTTAATTNATNPANASVPATAFQYYSKYTTYFPERLVWFCTDRKAEFYRMHWQEYYGGDCITQKAKDGFVNFSDYVATGCTLIPCCISGPYNEYSRLYDYFECGSN